MRLFSKLSLSQSIVASIFSASLLCSSMAHSQGSETMSKGSAMVSKGSITLTEGASQVLSQAAAGSVAFTVDVIEVAGDVAEITLISAATGSQASAEITVSITSATVASLAIVAGTVIEIMTIYAENKADILGFLLLQKGDVMLFVSPNESTLTLHSETL